MVDNVLVDEFVWPAQKARGVAVGADSGSPCERLAEVLVDGRAARRLEALQLAGGRDVEFLRYGCKRKHTSIQK